MEEQVRNNTTFYIPEENIDKLRKKMTTIKNKCKKYGCEFTYEELGEEIKCVSDEDGNKYYIKYIVVKVEGKAIINDWQFVAQIVHEEKGNVIRKAIDIEVPKKYYTTSPICEHCNTLRNRNDTYLVMNVATKEFKQVGRTCLKDFTNGMDSQLVAMYLTAIDELEKCESYGCSFGICSYLKTRDVLLYASECVKKFGYRKSDSGEDSTRNMVLCFMTLFGDNHMNLSTKEKEMYSEMIKKSNFNHNSDDNNKIVDGALSMIAESEESSDYMHNLKVISANEYVRIKDLGYLVSLIPTYNRVSKFVEKENAEKEKRNAEIDNSKYVGEVGEQISFKVNSAEYVSSFVTAYGVTNIYKFTDENLNVYIWYSTKGIENIDKVMEVVGKVKGHKTYNNVEQTIITRCKVNY